MANKGFGNSIGGRRGSGEITANSIGLSDAAGSPCGGYAVKTSYGSPANVPAPERGAGLANTQMSTRKPGK